MANSLVLLGDSILDNAPYTGPEPCTTDHLRRLLPDWTLRPLALDGATMADVPSQLDELEARASIAVLSVGGNDALEHIDVLESRQIRSDELLHRLVRIADDFEKRYFTTARTCVLSLTASRTDRIYLRERLAFAALHVRKRMLDRFTVPCQNELSGRRKSDC